VTTPLPRLVHLASGQLHDVPVGDDWLSEEERMVLARLKLEKRRGEWRLGRWLARRAVLAALAADARANAAARPVPLITPMALPALSEIAVIAAADGAPEVHGVALPISLSVSHSNGRGLAAAGIGGSALGCDLELIEPRSERFVRDWLTAGEGGRVASAPEATRALLANLCWSGKESASKVLRVGLRFDTRAFEVELPGQSALEQGETAGEWSRLSVTAVKTRDRFQGLWRVRAGFVETLLGRELFEVSE
jgi:4'-phosphopantetheinyl transferase